MLIVDDEAVFGAALQRHLMGLGLNALHFANPEHAFQAAARVKPSAVLLDLCLDGTRIKDTRTAEHVLERFKNNPETRSVPVIIISGKYEDHDTAVAFRAKGADSFFIKSDVMDRDGCFLQRFDVLMKNSPEDDQFPVERIILVVDDEDDTARLLSFVFDDKSYRIHWVKSGTEALRLVPTLSPDLVILDLHMPGLNGRETCRKLREKNSDGSLYLPIVMLTGDSRIGQDARCLDLGADVYLTKPVRNDLLKAQIDSLLRRARFILNADGGVALGGLSLDCRTHQLVISGQKEPVELTKSEAGILLFLISARGKAINHMMLHKRIARSSTLPNPKSSTMKSHISHIRAKLGKHGALIESVNGETSYRLNVDAARSLA